MTQDEKIYFKDLSKPLQFAAICGMVWGILAIWVLILGIGAVIRYGVGGG
jgi:hypothetical protein